MASRARADARAGRPASAPNPPEIAADRPDLAAGSPAIAPETAAIPPAAAPSDPAVARLVPVPVAPRHDGWTPARQRAFIEALADCGSVTEAAHAVGMTPQSARRLRARARYGTFDLAWQSALEMGLERIEDALVARAIDGVAVPHFYKGEKVGEYRRYDTRLALWLLARHPRPRLTRTERERVDEDWARALDRLERGRR